VRLKQTGTKFAEISSGLEERTFGGVCSNEEPFMLYTVAIAVCLSATPIQSCGEVNSVAWVVAPEHPNSMVGCMRHGMLYAAESRLVTEGSYAKVFCSSGTPASKSAALLDH
jgi:hypothetical protein